MGKWPHERYHRLARVLLIASIILLILVFTPLGLEINGNRNWIFVAGFSFQPAEAAKLAFSVWAAYALSQKLKTRPYGRDLLIPVVFPFGMVIVLLIMAGRDLGTVLIMLMIIRSE